MTIYRMRLRALILVAILALTGCAAAEDDGAAFLREHGLAGMSAEEVIDHLDRLADAERPDDFMASVRPETLVLSDEREEVEMDLPDDRFYVAFAPYVNQTHDCFYHSLTTCRGELSNQDVQVSLVDNASGEVIVEETVTTFANGFAGLWLPRDLDATLTVTADGKSGTTAVSTDADSATCLTDLLLT